MVAAGRGGRCCSGPTARCGGHGDTHRRGIARGGDGDGDSTGETPRSGHGVGRLPPPGDTTISRMVVTGGGGDDRRPSELPRYSTYVDTVTAPSGSRRPPTTPPSSTPAMYGAMYSVWATAAGETSTTGYRRPADDRAAMSTATAQRQFEKTPAGITSPSRRGRPAHTPVVALTSQNLTTRGGQEGRAGPAVAGSAENVALARPTAPLATRLAKRRAQRAMTFGGCGSRAEPVAMVACRATKENAEGGGREGGETGTGRAAASGGAGKRRPLSWPNRRPRFGMRTSWGGSIV